MLQRTSRLLTLLLGFQSALPPLSIDMSLPALPAVGLALGASSDATQWTLSTFLFGFAIGQLVLGPASDRLGRRPVLVAGLTLYVLAGSAVAMASSIDALILWRLLQGFGACAGVVVSRAVVRDVFEVGEGASRQSMLSAIATLAMLLAPMVGAVLLQFLGWRAVYAVLAVMGQVLLVATFALHPETLPPGRRRVGSVRDGYAAVLGVRRTLGYGAVNGLTFGGLFAYISDSPSVFVGTLGVTPGAFSLLFALAAIALLAGSVRNSMLTRWISPRPLERFGYLVLGIATVLVCSLGPMFPHVPALITVLAVYIFASGIVMPNSIAAGLAPLPGVAATAAAFIGFSQMIVGAISAAIVGLILPGTVVGMVLVLAAFGVAAVAVGCAMELSGPLDPLC